MPYTISKIIAAKVLQRISSRNGKLDHAVVHVLAQGHMVDAIREVNGTFDECAYFTELDGVILRDSLLVEVLVECAPGIAPSGAISHEREIPLPTSPWIKN